MSTIYDFYRQRAIDSLAAEAELRAVQLQQAYYARLGQIGEERSRAVYLPPDRAAYYQDLEQQALADYQQQIADLTGAVEQQQAMIQQEYDTREQQYDTTMTTPWPQSRPDPLAPGAAPAIEPAPEPDSGFFTSLLGWFR